MADLSSIKMPTGVEYDFKDAKAREYVQSLTANKTVEGTRFALVDYGGGDISATPLADKVSAKIKTIQDTVHENPNPTEVNEISGITSLKIFQTNANLLIPEVTLNANSIIVGQSRTANGVTFTHNEDHSIKVSGTATADTTCYICEATDYSEHGIDKNMLLTGCPAGGGDSNYRLAYYEDGVALAHDAGSGIVIDKEQVFKTFRAAIIIKNATNCSDNSDGFLTFKPCLTFTDKTTQDTLTDDDKVFISPESTTFEVSWVNTPGTVYEGEAVYSSDKTWSIVNNGAKFVMTAVDQIYGQANTRKYIKYTNLDPAPNAAYPPICEVGTGILKSDTAYPRNWDCYIDPDDNAFVMVIPPSCDAVSGEGSNNINNAGFIGKSFVYRVATPTTYTLGKVGDIVIKPGVNYIWSSAGNIEVNCTSDLTHCIVSDRLLPQPPTANGTYKLQVVVSNGAVTYSWVSAT